MRPAISSLAVTQANGDFASIVYGLSADADIVIEVRNIAGRMIRAIPCGTASAGLNTATWNLRNSSGAAVPSGRYLCTITARTSSGTQATAVRTMTIRR
jgi:flagellar hook assembly protein FlgD